MIHAFALLQNILCSFARHMAAACSAVLLLQLVFAAPSLGKTTHGNTATQNADAIVALVKDTLLKQPNPYQGTLQVAIDPPDTSHYPACSRLQATLASGSTLRPQMSVRVQCQTPQRWTLVVRAQLQVAGFHYVANRQINPGEVLSQDDIHAVESDLLRLHRGVATDPSLIIGQVATQRIPSGRSIRMSALRDPQSILRGQQVRTEFRGNGFLVSGEGQAMQTGQPGSHIQVKTSSGQIITGIVIDAVTVLVPQ